MTIKQVSVFLENKTGRINEVTKTLSQHGINMHAFSMAETPDFGILRLLEHSGHLKTGIRTNDRLRCNDTIGK